MFGLIKDPFNLELLILNKEQIKRFGVVTSGAILEPNSNVFDSDGFFSTEIFGPLASKERNTKLGLVDLKIKIIHPGVYIDLISLRKFYKKILDGTMYARFDKKLKDFVLCSEDEKDAGTGSEFFLDHLDKVVFSDNGSVERAYKIEVLKSLPIRDLTMDKLIVWPAGLREYVVGEDGKVSEDEVNNLYRKTLALTNVLHNVNLNVSNSELLDPVRTKIQASVVELYKHFKGLLDGKNKLMQGGLAKRKLEGGTRNVITAIPNVVSDLEAEDGPGFNHTIVGIYQYMMGLSAVVKHYVYSEFIGKIMSPYDNTALLIDPKTLQQKRVSVPDKIKDYWTTLDGLDHTMLKLEQDDIKDEVITIKGNYLAMLYDTGTDVTLVLDPNTLEEGYNKKKLRPITYGELFYIAIMLNPNKHYSLLTRYPVAGLGGIYPTEPYVYSTTKGRKVKYHSLIGDEGKEMPEYPMIGEAWFNAMSPHFSNLSRLDGDFDGDKCNFTIMKTQDSSEEIGKVLNTRAFYITPDGKGVTYTSSDDVSQYVCKQLTRTAGKRFKK